MKKVLTFIMAMGLALSVVACGGSKCEKKCKEAGKELEKTGMTMTDKDMKECVAACEKAQ